MMSAVAGCPPASASSRVSCAEGEEDGSLSSRALAFGARVGGSGDPP